MHASLAFLLLMVIVATALPVARRHRARRRQLAALAMRCGWTYTPWDPWDLAGEMEGLWLGAWGHDRRCRDVFSVPAETGSLWLAVFRRQMASGRYRRSECFAVAAARLPTIFAGIAFLPKAQMFVPVNPFARYRRVALPENLDLSGRELWAERPASHRRLVESLATLMSPLPPDAALEVRGQWAVGYWPLVRPATPEDFVALNAAGGKMLEFLGSAGDVAAEHAEPA